MMLKLYFIKLVSSFKRESMTSNSFFLSPPPLLFSDYLLSNKVDKRGCKYIFHLLHKYSTSKQLEYNIGLHHESIYYEYFNAYPYSYVYQFK
jgi:hypothetical protein